MDKYKETSKIRVIIFDDISLARKSKQVFFSLALRNVRIFAWYKLLWSA